MKTEMQNEIRSEQSLEEWCRSGNVNFDATSATITAMQGGINTTSITLPVNGSEIYSGLQTTTATMKNSLAMPQKTITLLVPTTVYLVAQATFSAGTVKAFGSITAMRQR